ncbi:MAG: hypothetical protein EOP04_06905 [Proteobacteria bacterium]|nr:MAG: hypothetical protein EOP04_06905 [Pseudomonadota bacterium]
MCEVGTTMKLHIPILTVILAFSLLGCGSNLVESNKSNLKDDRQLFVPTDDLIFEPNPAPILVESEPIDIRTSQDSNETTEFCVEKCRNIYLNFPGDNPATPTQNPSPVSNLASPDAPRGNSASNGSSHSGSGGSNLPGLDPIDSPHTGDAQEDSRTALMNRLDRMLNSWKAADDFKASLIPLPKSSSVANLSSSIDISRMFAESFARLEAERAAASASLQSQMESDRAKSISVLLSASSSLDQYKNVKESFQSKAQELKTQLNKAIPDAISPDFKNKRNELAQLTDKSKSDSTRLEDEIRSSLPEVTVPPAQKEFKTSPYTAEGIEVRKANVYLNMAKDEVERVGRGEGKAAAQNLIQSSAEAIQQTDSAFAAGEHEVGNRGLEIAYKLANVAIAIAPLAVVIAAPQALVAIAVVTSISFAKDYYEARTGKALFGGAPLSPTERGFSYLSAAMAFPGGRMLATSARAFQAEIGLLTKFTTFANVETQAAKTGIDAAEAFANKAISAVDNAGWKPSPELVRDLRATTESLLRDGKLPGNYVTRSQALSSGWIPSKGNLADVLPGKLLGGDTYKNLPVKLPTNKSYIEADIGFVSTNLKNFRGTERMVFSDDISKIYLTNDHYETFIELL